MSPDSSTNFGVAGAVSETHFFLLIRRLSWSGIFETLLCLNDFSLRYGFKSYGNAKLDVLNEAYFAIGWSLHSDGLLPTRLPSLVSIPGVARGCSTHLFQLTATALLNRNLKFRENVYLPPCVICHMSHVTYHMSCFTCFFCFFLQYIYIYFFF